MVSRLLLLVALAMVASGCGYLDTDLFVSEEKFEEDLVVYPSRGFGSGGIGMSGGHSIGCGGITISSTHIFGHGRVIHPMIVRPNRPPVDQAALFRADPASSGVFADSEDETAADTESIPTGWGAVWQEKLTDRDARLRSATSTRAEIAPR